MQKTIWICVYRDTIEQHEDDWNLSVVQVTENFLKKYVSECKQEYFATTEDFLNEYTADDTEDFYKYAMEHNAVLGIENW